MRRRPVSKTKQLYAQKVRKLNDLFRTTMIGGIFRLSENVAALSPQEKSDIIGVVRSFNNFTKANDPHNEHDFSFFHHRITEDGKTRNEKFFFKIDYYDLNEEYHSPNAADPEVTKRILTIATADEY